MDAAFSDESIGIRPADHAVGHQHLQHFGEFQFVFRNVLSSHILTLVRGLADYTVIGRGGQSGWGWVRGICGKTNEKVGRRWLSGTQTKISPLLREKDS